MRWERTPQAMGAAMEAQFEIIDALVAKHGGRIHDRAGDGVFAVFLAGNPLECALDIQLALQQKDWGPVGGLEVRLGVHAHARAGHGGFDQAAANRAARMAASAWGGQIVASAEAAVSYKAPAGAEFIELGAVHFKGIDEPLFLLSLVHPGLQKREFPPLRSAQEIPPSIPAFASPLFGRAREAAAIAARLEQSRLVTIAGPGGAGKTRLATHIAAERSRTCAVAFVAVDSAGQAGDLLAVLASGLRFPLQGPAAPEAQLIDYLRAKRMLIVLDGADAFAGQGAFLAALIRACQNLSVLITSREPMGALGESVFRLGGLPLEGAGAQMEQSPAFQLFAYEARAHGVDCVLARDDAAFAEICALVEGSPLALRLLAKWRRLLSLQEILSQLRSGHEALAGAGPSGAFAEVFEGSWRLLAPEQQRALARLSVFTGAFDWRAAEAVTEIGFAAYAALADKSLLDETDERRFRVHALVRGYARAKLALDRSAQARALDRHARYYLTLVEDAVAAPLKDQRARFDEVQKDYANLRAAWMHACAHSAELARRSAAALHHFLTMRAMLREGSELFGVDPGDVKLRPLLKSILAATLVQQGETETAQRLALEVFAGRGEIAARAFARDALGAAAHIRGDYERARRHYEKEFLLWREAAQPLNASFAATSLTSLHFAHGRASEAERWARRAYRLSLKSRNAVGMRIVHVITGDIAAQAGRHEAARDNYRRALDLEAAGDTPHVTSAVLRRLGSLARALGQNEEALQYHRQALELASEVGEQRMQAFALAEVGEDLRRQGQTDAARRDLLEAIGRALALGIEPLVSQALISLARVELSSGAPNSAARIAAALAERDLSELATDYCDLAQNLGAEIIAASGNGAIEDILDDIAVESALGPVWALDGANPSKDK